MIDSHAHLDACQASPEELVDRARAAGVEEIVTIGMGIDSCRVSLSIATTCDDVHAVLGIHPHLAADADAGRLEELRELLGHPKAVALGEAGLDYYRDYAPHDLQRALFAAQLELAGELKKPVVVHTRQAETDTTALLDRFDGTIVLHCFSSPALLAWALERGCYFSFAGNVTYPAAGDLRAAARSAPGERLLIETDCPFLAPQAKRGRPNEPAYLIHTLRSLAETLGTSEDELAELTTSNTRRAFSLP